MGRIARTLPLGLIFVTLVACGSGIFQQPQVTLESVRIAGLGLRGGTLLVNLQIVNPNRFALNASELEYQIAVANTEAANDTTWLDLATGVYQEPFSVGAGATESVEVPVEFTYSGLGGAAASVLRAGTFNYRATGQVQVRTPIGSREVPFRRSGMVSLLAN